MGILLSSLERITNEIVLKQGVDSHRFEPGAFRQTLHGSTNPATASFSASACRFCSMISGIISDLIAFLVSVRSASVYIVLYLV
jgi:hypothetical protein